MTSAIKERTEYSGIDLFKLIFSFFIVFIHCHPSVAILSAMSGGIWRNLTKDHPNLTVFLTSDAAASII